MLAAPEKIEIGVSKFPKEKLSKLSVEDAEN